MLRAEGDATADGSVGGDGLSNAVTPTVTVACTGVDVLDDRLGFGAIVWLDGHLSTYGARHERRGRLVKSGEVGPFGGASVSEDEHERRVVNPFDLEPASVILVL